MDQLVGRSLNRYKLLELLGVGGVGAVYKSQDTVLQRLVAVKVMRPELASQPHLQERFLQEARTAARLDNPGIVRVHDFGQDGELLYIVMEYIPGDNLRKMLRDLRAQNKWVLLSEAVEIVRQVCLSVDYAHEQGVLHRDLKPDNLMLKPEYSEDIPYRVVLTDLGLAKLVHELQVPAALLEESAGTPAYMSPEQALGRSTSPRSDVYSLGVLLYELAAGRLPFPARTLEDAARYASEPVPLPRAYRPDLPNAVENIILMAMQKDPDLRYASAGQMAEDLEAAMPVASQVEDTPTEIAETVSLMTQYEHTLVDLSRSPFASASAWSPEVIRQDIVDVHLPDGSSKAVSMVVQGLTIGRDQENVIVLDYPNVSRRHARIDFDGETYWVSDLNSRNGTFLADNRLLPGVPEVWTAERALRIGDALLLLKRQEDQITLAAQGPPLTRPVGAAVNPGLIYSSPGAGRVGIFMETVQLSVLPGESATAAFVIINQGPVVDNFRISIMGIPADWIPAPPPVIQLPPGGQQEVNLSIRPPRSSHSRPGRYPLTLQVSSQEAPDQVAQVRVTLTVAAFSKFSCDMRPRQLYSGQTTQVSVQNQGNTQEAFTVHMVDTFQNLLFDPEEGRFSLAEGELASADFRISPRRPRWVGASRTHPFTARITPSTGAPQTLTGELINTSIFPTWVIPVLLLACLCLAALAAYGYIDVLSQPNTVRQTAIAETQSVAQTQASLALANQATLQAATVTQAWHLTETAAVIFTLTPPELTPEIPSPTPEPPTATAIVIVVTSTPEPVTPSPTPEPPTPTDTPTLTLQPVTATPTPLGGSPLMAFSSNRDGQQEIYVMLPDGASQTRITSIPAADTAPAFSPDFTRIAFVSNRDGINQIYVMNSDGSGQTRLSNNAFNDTNPAWSPDGSRIAFTSDRDGNLEIYVMNADGSNQVRLTNNAVADDNPVWSPGGNRIAFDTVQADAREIFVVNPDGSGLAQVTNTGDLNQEPSYSPDGGRLAFVSNRDGSFDVFVMNSDGANQARLSNLAGDASSPDWSRDANWIAFSTPSNGGGEIITISSDGAQLVNRTNNAADDTSPSW